MSFFAKLYKSQEAARERNKREQRRSDTFKFGTDYMKKCHLAALERERRLVQQEFERIQKEIEDSPRLDFSGNGPLIPRAKHEQYDDEMSDSDDDDGEIPNENEHPADMNEEDSKDEIDVHHTVLFFRNNPSVLVPILTVNGKDTEYLEAIGLVKKPEKVKEEEEDLDEVDDKKNNANNRNVFGRRNFSNIRSFVNTGQDRNLQNDADTRSNSNNSNIVDTRKVANIPNVNAKQNLPNGSNTGAVQNIPNIVVDTVTDPNVVEEGKTPSIPKEPPEAFVPFYLRTDYDPSYGNMSTDTVKKYAILLRQRTPVGYRRGRHGALQRHGQPLDLFSVAQGGMQHARDNVNARLGDHGDEAYDRAEAQRPRITKANAPSYQPSDPEMYNADGTLRTCHQLPGLKEALVEAGKANYLRGPDHPVVSNKLDINEIFAKD